MINKDDVRNYLRKQEWYWQDVNEAAQSMLDNIMLGDDPGPVHSTAEKATQKAAERPLTVVEDIDSAGRSKPHKARSAAALSKDEKTAVNAWAAEHGYKNRYPSTAVSARLLAEYDQAHS